MAPVMSLATTPFSIILLASSQIRTLQGGEPESVIVPTPSTVCRRSCTWNCATSASICFEMAP